EKFFVFARDVCRDCFSIDDVRHKHGLAILARDAFPAKGDIGDLKLHSSSTSSSLSSIYKEDRREKTKRKGKLSNRVRTDTSFRCRAQEGTPRSRRGSTEYRLAITDNSFGDKPALARAESRASRRCVASPNVQRRAR